MRHGDPRLFWSLSFALTAATWERVGGLCEDYTGYGAEDTDFAARATSRGVGLWWVGGAPAYHQYHPTHSPPVQHLDDILRDGGRVQQMRAQVSELRHAADRTLDPELRQRLEARIRRLQQHCGQDPQPSQHSS
ncbi:DUF6381 family protein [Streptomyces sp. NPDC052000]|uniref:glycosyltransferase family 2 protein n=1 Tax=Streptomyces sp. NPDC052000 TaxID=3155676 RepID=UPI003450DE1B